MVLADNSEEAVSSEEGEVDGGLRNTRWTVLGRKAGPSYCLVMLLS